MNYDRSVSDAKSNVTTMICKLVSSDERTHAFAVEQIPAAIDYLNKTWGELTDALVRQRDERDRVIRSLVDQLAEARK